MKTWIIILIIIIILLVVGLVIYFKFYYGTGGAITPPKPNPTLKDLNTETFMQGWRSRYILFKGDKLKYDKPEDVYEALTYVLSRVYDGLLDISVLKKINDVYDKLIDNTIKRIEISRIVAIISYVGWDLISKHKDKTHFTQIAEKVSKYALKEPITKNAHESVILSATLVLMFEYFKEENNTTIITEELYRKCVDFLEVGPDLKEINTNGNIITMTTDYSFIDTQTSASVTRGGEYLFLFYFIKDLINVENWVKPLSKTVLDRINKYCLPIRNGSGDDVYRDSFQMYGLRLATLAQYFNPDIPIGDFSKAYELMKDDFKYFSKYEEIVALPNIKYNIKPFRRDQIICHNGDGQGTYINQNGDWYTLNSKSFMVKIDGDEALNEIGYWRQALDFAAPDNIKLHQNINNKEEAHLLSNVLYSPSTIDPNEGGMISYTKLQDNKTTLIARRLGFKQYLSQMAYETYMYCDYGTAVMNIYPATSIVDPKDKISFIVGVVASDTRPTIIINNVQMYENFDDDKNYTVEPMQKVVINTYDTNRSKEKNSYVYYNYDYPMTLRMVQKDGLWKVILEQNEIGEFGAVLGNKTYTFYYASYYFEINGDHMKKLAINKSTGSIVYDDKFTTHIYTNDRMFQRLRINPETIEPEKTRGMIFIDYIHQTNKYGIYLDWSDQRIISVNNVNWAWLDGQRYAARNINIGLTG